MKEKLIIFIFILIFVSSCNKNRPESINKLLIGEWRLDSISGNFKTWKDDYIYFTDNNTFWKFTYNNDKYLIDSCLTISGTEILITDKKLYSINLIDSSALILNDKIGNKFYYHNQSRIYEEDYQQNLKEFITKDSLHKKINGWWKLTDATWKPIRLINYGYAQNFTMHLNKNGQADIYIENNIDSLVQYHWKTLPKGISIGRLCIAGSNSPIHYLDKNKMQMEFNSKWMDTLTFERCAPLKK